MPESVPASRFQTIPLATALVAAVLVAACGDDEPGHRTVAVVDTVAGVERLTYPAASAGALDWPVDTVAVLGDAFADDAYQFNEVDDGGLAADAAGNLYVLDRQGKRVLKYGPDGRHLATYGREGEGPGELSQPMSLAVGPGDTVWVADFTNTRFTGYPQDGGDPATVAFPEDAGIPGQRMAVLGDGFLTTFFQPFFFRRNAGGGMDMSRGGDQEGDERTIPLLRLDRSLAPVDTLWQTVEPPMDRVQLEAGGRVMITMMSRRFYPDFQWDELSDGAVVVTDSAAYALHFVDPSGEMARTIFRQPAPRMTTETDQERAREQLREQSQGGGVRVGEGGPGQSVQEEMLRQRLEKMTFADLIPRVVELRVDPADRVWVGVSEESPDEVDRIDVYHRDGTLLGELRGVPFPDVFIGVDRIGVLRRDELDVQQVVILRIQGTGTEVAEG